jgi:ATP-binding cassette subfamily C protein
MVQSLLINVVTIIAETATAILILGALLFLQPTTAIIATVYFALVAILQHKLLSKSANNAGELVVKHATIVYENLLDAHSLSKLLSINSSQTLNSHLEEQRRHLALSRGRVMFLGMLPRYFMELILALGIAVIAGGSYFISGSKEAISAVTVFAAAGFRLLPSVNRIQGLILQLFSTVPAARLAIPLAGTQRLEPRKQPANEKHALVLDKISFRYPTGANQVLSDINLVLTSGLQYAIVGPSGAGKTTLVDICLGLLEPQQGTV